MAKTIIFGEEARTALENGVNKVADPVGSTMGACGKTVIISNHYNFDPMATKDGVTVASCIILPDPKENVGARLVRNAAQSTAREAGDGTTQTAVLAQSLIKNGLKAVRDGVSPQKLKAGMDKAVDSVVETLKKIAKPVEDNDTIKNIATISANNDEKIGQLIADAYAKIGHQGLMVIESSNSIETKIEVVDGVEIPKGFVSPDFVNDKGRQRVVFDNVLYLVADYSIDTMEQLAPIFNRMKEASVLHHPVVIFASDFQGEAFSSLLLNHRKGNINVCLVKAPSQYRRQYLDDVAVVTGATLICDENGLKLEDALVAHLGASTKSIITETTTSIIDGDSDPDKFNDQKNSIMTQRDDYKKDGNMEMHTEWEKRLARISGSICVIRVGGSTDVEMEERKARVDDACRAVKSSIEEGIVIGGGAALMICMKNINQVIYADSDEVRGAALVLMACQAPLKKMLENAGLESAIVVELSDKLKETNDIGYNVKTKQFENLLETGVIDPAKVIRCAIQNAASVATYAITTDYILVEM